MKQSILNLLALPLLTLTLSPLSASDEDQKDLYSPLGIRVRSFVISPSFESINEWNDNIFSRQNDVKSDFVFHLKPSLKIKSDWSRHALNFAVGSDIVFHHDFDTEDKQDYFVTLDGKLDVLQDSFATAKFYYKNNKEDRGSPEVIASVSTEPLETETVGLEVAYEHKINRVKVNLTHDFNYEDHKDNKDPFGSTVDNSERTRYNNTTSVRLGYELFSGYEAYLKGGFNFIDYANVFKKQNNLDRSSQGFNLGLGMTVDLSHLLKADTHLGYQRQDYDAANLKTVSGLAGGLDLTWTPTRLTTVRTGINRATNETTQTNLAGFFSTKFSASVEHKLMRNITLNFHTSYTFNDYKGTNAVNREEDVYNTGLFVKYRVNRNFYVKTGYDYKGRATNLNGSDYDINNIYLNLGAQL